MQRALLDQLLADRATKVPVALATNLRTGAQTLLHPFDERVATDWPPEIGEAARAALVADRATNLETAEGPIFINVFNPPLRLIAVGAVHIAQALGPMAALAGYEVAVIDPRRAFATADRFPGMTLLHDWPDEAMAACKPDLRTAVVTLTHDPKLDDPALAAALRSDAFYIGSLGSRKTHAARLERLRRMGFAEPELARIHGPVGLPIGARSPAEIALAVLAQVTQTLRQEQGRMIFGRIPIDDAEGAILGHSTSLGSRRLKKGHRLTAPDLAAFRTAGLTEVIAARLEPEDVPEDVAAAEIAAAAAGTGVKAQAAFTGRSNLYAEAPGIALLDAARVDRLNAVDEALTIATVAPYEVVEAGQMLATVKVIPFAAPRTTVQQCAALAAEGGPLLRVAAFRDEPVGLVMTRLSGTKASVLDKTVASVRDRVEALGSHLAAWGDCEHEAAAVAEAISELQQAGCRPILVFGASAIVDRRDVVPAGIEQAGGTVEHFGMPVDPGNLLLLARLGDIPVVGVPGCARSPKLNGFDWVLQRLLAEVPVGRADIVRLGAGGLLKEIPSRPQPREGQAPVRAPRAPKIAALVLAAGQSRRMGRNKLLEPLGGQAMIAHVVDAVLASAARPVVVVTGHQADALRGALAGRPIRLVHNPDFAEGLSTSLRHGLAALPPDCDGVLVCLGDMPGVRGEHLDRLIASFNPAEGRAICVPTAGGKRGNPILWAARYFPEMKAVGGDVGARHLLGEHADEVCEVEVADRAVLLDVDTPAALAALHEAG